MSQMTPPPDTNMPHNSFNDADSSSLSRVALWSMILGIPGLCVPLLGIAALIMGIVGMTQTGEGKRRGMGFAITGTVLGVLGFLSTSLIVLILIGGIFLPAVGAARQTAMELQSMTQLRSIGHGMSIYADNNDYQFPPTDQTFDILLDQGLIEDELLVSPLEDGDGVSYILTGVRELSFDSTEIIAYEDPKHMDRRVNVLFADMHVEFVDHTVFEAMLAEQEAERDAGP